MFSFIKFNQRKVPNHWKPWLISTAALGLAITIGFIIPDIRNSEQAEQYASIPANNQDLNTNPAVGLNELQKFAEAS